MVSLVKHFQSLGKELFENETCGTLFFDIEHILKEKIPRAFMLENVRNLTAHDKGNTFKVIISHLEAYTEEALQAYKTKKKIQTTE